MERKSRLIYPNDCAKHKMTAVQARGWNAFVLDLPWNLKVLGDQWVAYRGDDIVATASSWGEIYGAIEGIPPAELLVRRVEPFGPPVDLRRLPHGAGRGYFLKK